MTLSTLWKILKFECQFIGPRSKKEAYADCLLAWLVTMLILSICFYGIWYIEDILRWMAHVLPIGDIPDRPPKKKEWHRLTSGIMCSTGFTLFTTQYVKSLYERIKNRSYETI
jgi:Extended Signal Peptide of Type V secretion system